MQIIYWELGDCVVCARSLLGTGSRVSRWAQDPPSRTWGSGGGQATDSTGHMKQDKLRWGGHSEESDRGTVNTQSPLGF